VTPKVNQRVPGALGTARVLERDGREVALESLWKERDALVVFVRHFACAGCSEHVTELGARLGELDALGVRTVLVGCGDPAHIDGFIERQRLGDKKVEVYTDPSLEAFRRAGLERSRWGTFGPVAITQLLRAMINGHSNGSPQGDRTQQGGTLLVDKDGIVRFYDRGESIGDHAPVVEVVDAALVLRATGSVLP
jgi:peroxiredoxin